MTERTANQIKAMKQQTIGVEVEMNSITRQKAAKVAAEFLRNRQIREHRRPQRLQHLECLGRTGERMEIPEGRFHRRAGRAEMRTGHPDPEPTGTSKPCRSFADSSDMQAQRATPPEDAESTSTSEPRATHLRAFATSPTSWPAMKA